MVQPNVNPLVRLPCSTIFPTPPPTHTTEYDSAFFHGVKDALAPPSAHSHTQELRVLECLLPERTLCKQLLGFWDAHPAVRQRFPGGVVHFAQWASEVPEDVLEDLFITVDALEQVREGGEMPGGMLGGEMMVNFVDPDDVEDEPPALVAPQPAPPRAIVEEAEAEEDDEEEEEDDGTHGAPVKVTEFPDDDGFEWVSRKAVRGKGVGEDKRERARMRQRTRTRN